MFLRRRHHFHLIDVAKCNHTYCCSRLCELEVCELLFRNDPCSSVVWVSDRLRLRVVARVNVHAWEGCLSRLRQLGHGHLSTSSRLHLQDSFVRLLYTCYLPLSVSARAHNHQHHDDIWFHDARHCYQFGTAADRRCWTGQTSVRENVVLAVNVSLLLSIAVHGVNAFVLSAWLTHSTSCCFRFAGFNSLVKCFFIDMVKCYSSS